jgi:hypothetical protein
LQLAHAAELAHTPGELWPSVKENQARQILAVQQGNVDIVDRRSWVFPYLPESLHRIKQPIIKGTPYNVRRFSRTPVPRRAINLIKNSITSLEWDIVPIEGLEQDQTDDQKARIKIAKNCFLHPNNTENFQQFQEEGIDDMCVNGAFVIEPQLTPYIKRPWKMWTVDSSTIRIFADWKESTPDQPHYAQMTGLKGERGIIVFYDNELIYIKDNPQVDSPFGLGKMEVAFQSINALLGVQDMAGRAGSDQIHKTWLWWPQTQSPSNIDIIRRHIMNDLEGQAKVSLVAGMPAPQVIDINPVVLEDLLIPWQEMLIRMVANGFDISAMAVNLERDVNRSTGEVLDDRDFRSSVVPMAHRLESAYTTSILHRLLGWTDLKFMYLNMDDPDAQTKLTMQQQMFACNATTPNEIRKAMGLPKSESPYSDCTQFEMILVNTQAAATLQQQAADKQFSRQMTMFQGQPGGSGGPGGGSGAPGGGEGESASASAKQKLLSAGKQQKMLGPGKSGAPAGGGKGLKVPPLQIPKLPTLPGMSLPKMPMAGSIYSAVQVAKMGRDQLEAAVTKGLVPQNKRFLAQQMESQEPGILQQLSEELKDYFKELRQENESESESEELEPSESDEEDQLQRFQDFQHDPPEIERVINKGTEHSPPVSTHRITKTTSHSFGSPNVNPAFQRSGTGKEIDHNPSDAVPGPNGYPLRRRRKK